MLVVGDNAYFDSYDADDIVLSEFLDDSPEYKCWFDLTSDVKDKLIVKYTRLIDKSLFLGVKAKSFNTGLAFPRIIKGALIECPLDVKIAILMQCIYDILYSKDTERTLRDKGVKSYSIEGASISFDNNTGNVKLDNGVYRFVHMEYLQYWTY